MKNIYYFVTISIVLFYSSLNAQWIPTNGPGTFESVMVFAVSGSNLFAGIEGGGVYLSTNNGTLWTAVNNGLTDGYVRSLAFSGTNLFAGTEIAGVFLSTNNGASWTEVNNGMTNTSAYALAVSGTNIFAAGFGGVYRSTNNGGQWTPVNTGLNNNSVFALAISGTNIFAGTFNGVYFSTNNGTNWTAAGLPNSNVWSFAFSGTNLFAATEIDGVYRSTNNGVSWTAVNNGLPNGTGVLDLAISGTNLFAGTEGDGVFLTTNNGTSWTDASTGLTAPTVYALAVSGTNLFAGTLFDGAWRRPLDEMIPVELISFTASVTGNAVTLSWTTATELNNLGFEVQKSTDNENWNAIAFVEGTGTTTAPQNYSYVDNSVSSGKYFYRLKQVDFNGSFEFSNVVEVQTGIPNEFVLAQNYPNPFNPSTTIKYSLPEAGKITLKLYDVLGNEIAVLEEGFKERGNYNINFTSDLASGFYLYRLQHSKGIITKKMLILK